MVTIVSYLIRCNFVRSVRVSSMNSFRRSKNRWFVFRIIPLSTLLFLIAISASFVHKTCTPMRPALKMSLSSNFVSHLTLVKLTWPQYSWKSLMKSNSGSKSSDAIFANTSCIVFLISSNNLPSHISTPSVQCTTVSSLICVGHNFRLLSEPSDETSFPLRALYSPNWCQLFGVMNAEKMLR